MCPTCDAREAAEQLAAYERDRAKHGFKRLYASSRAKFLRTVSARFGRLIVLSYAGVKPRWDGAGGLLLWNCACDCGRVKVVKDQHLHLSAGATRGCGSCLGRAVPVAVTEVAARWLALAIEFEGTLGVYRLNAWRGRYPTHQARVEIGVVADDAVVLEQFIRAAGMGKITALNGAGEFRRRGVQVQLSNHEAIALCEVVEPFLVTKTAQSRTVIGFPLSGRGQRVDPEVFRHRQELAERTAHLNAVGRSGRTSPEASERAKRWEHLIAAMPDRERASLLALVLDFEGTIGVRRSKHGKSAWGMSHEPYLYVGQVVRRRALLDVVAALAGTGTVTGPYRRRRGDEADLCSWRVGGAEAIRLARWAAPHLMLKREQARRVAEFPLWDRGPNPMPLSLFHTRERLSAEVAALNNRYAKIQRAGT